MNTLSMERNELVDEFQISDDDTGSPEVQIALQTRKIDKLTEHMKSQPQDYAARRGLKDLVEKRKKNLSYLRENHPDRYRNISNKLDL